MYELIHFDNQSQKETYGRDAFGEFGTILASDSDLAVPELSDFQTDPQLAITAHLPNPSVATKTKNARGGNQSHSALTN